jgi:hypothetical protein
VKKESHQFAHSVEKNSQNRNHLHAKNVELKFRSLFMDHMDHMDLMDLTDQNQKEKKVNILMDHMDPMDLMDHHQKLNAQVVAKKLNSHIIHLKWNKRY